MAAALDATIGGATANTYNTEAELDTAALELLPEPVAWTKETVGSDLRIRAAITATRTLDRESFPRARVDIVQALEWPRAGVQKPETGGFYVGINYGGGGSTGFYLPTEIPGPIKTAHAKLTFFLITQVGLGIDPFAPNDDAGIAAENLGGDLQTTYEVGATWLTLGARFMAQVIRPLLSEVGLVYAPRLKTVRG